jgi:hypothetical protein
MMRRLALLPLLALCRLRHHLRARVITKEVRVPVPVKCATVAPPDPSYSDSPSALKAAADVFEQAKLLLAGRKQRDARIIELKAAVAGCTCGGVPHEPLIFIIVVVILLALATIYAIRRLSPATGPVQRHHPGPGRGGRHPPAMIANRAGLF